MPYILIQAIGALGAVAAVIAFQCKKNTSILFFRTLTEFFFTLQYFMLGAYNGMIMSLIECVRNVIFSKMIAKNKKTTAVMIFFAVILTFFGFLIWEGPRSIFVIIATVLSTFAYGNKNETFVRGTVFISSSSWLCYDYSVGSIAGVLCEAFTLVSIIIGIIRFDILPKLKK